METHLQTGSYPYFRLARKAIYVTRGFEAEADDTGILLSEWLDVREKIPELSVDEAYEIRNPHTDTVEKWIQRGRTRLQASDGRHGWFSYMPRHISAQAGGKLPGVRLLNRFEKARAEAGGNPSLSEWREYVSSNRYLRLEETLTCRGKTISIPGRAVTVSKSGGAIVFRPSAAFIYFGPPPYKNEEPDPVFLDVSHKIAGLLHAGVNTDGFL